MAVGHERLHPQLLGQVDGLAVAGFSRLALRRLTPRPNLTEEAQGICLVAAFLVPTGEHQRTLSEGVRLLQTARQQMRLPQGKTTERLKAYRFCCHGLFQRLREQRYSVGDAPA